MSQRKAEVLAQVLALIGPDLDRTNQIIREQLNARVSLIPELGSHLIESGGKRLRPILTLLSARMFGYQGDRHALLAAVVEFIHTATLLHDDVVDHSTTRRGQATANAVWGEKAPVLVGDYLFSRSFQLLVEFGNLQVLKILADACAVISEGEVQQLVISRNLDTSEETYIEVVTGKTATLFAAASQLGPVLTGRPAGEEACLARYGMHLGRAFQIVDDALDYAADQVTLGKKIGGDFQEGKITLPLIHAFNAGTPEERAFWRLCIEQNDPPPQGLERAIALVQERGSVEYSLARATEHARLAKEELTDLPDGPERQALAMLADFSVERNY